MTHSRLFSIRLEHGQTVTEYALLLAFVVLAAFATIPFFGSSVAGLFTRVVETVGSVTGA
jgi:Flp pilus assembly pilin Flp